MICRIVRMNHFSLFQLNLRKPQENPQVDAMWRGMRKIRNLSESFKHFICTDGSKFGTLPSKSERISCLCWVIY